MRIAIFVFAFACLVASALAIEVNVYSGANCTGMSFSQRIYNGNCYNNPLGLGSALVTCANNGSVVLQAYAKLGCNGSNPQSIVLPANTCKQFSNYGMFINCYSNSAATVGASSILLILGSALAYWFAWTKRLIHTNRATNKQKPLSHVRIVLILIFA